jgi:hypothetical protein
MPGLIIGEKFMRRIRLVIYFFLILSGLFVFQISFAYEVDVYVSDSNPNIGEEITISIEVDEGVDIGGGAGAMVRLDFGDGNTIFLPDCTNPSGCTYSETYSYLTDGLKTIEAYVVWSAADEDTDTVEVNVGGGTGVCVPDGCNANCPVGCSVNEDPDCGCLDGDGCCGIGCDDTNDNDCGSGGGTSRYRNPLVWSDIPGFIWGAIMYIFGHAIVLLVLFILIGAYVLTTSGGNTQRIKLGKNIIVWAIIGYIVMLLARGVIIFIWDFIKS